MLWPIRRLFTFVEFNGRHTLKDMTNNQIPTDAIYMAALKYKRQAYDDIKIIFFKSGFFLI